MYHMTNQALAHTGDDIYTYHFGMMDGTSWFGIGGFIIMILFWALIILGIVWLVRYIAGTEDKDKQKGFHDDPADILRERYARSEIDKDEFNERMEELRKSKK